MPQTLLDAALMYAARGWPVFPLAPRQKRPATGHGFKDASADPGEIQAWWRREPRANVGVPTGAATFDALDIDGPEGAASLAALEAEHGESLGLERLPRQRTGRADGGTQVLFRGGTLRTTARWRPGLDARGEGGYVVVPPSVHPSGLVYAWLLSPLDAAPGDPPKWLAAMLREPAGRGANGSPRGAHQTPLFGSGAELDHAALDPTARALLAMAFGAELREIPASGRNDTLMRLGCSLRARGQEHPLILQILDLANEHLCRPPLDSAEVAGIAASVARYSVSPVYQRAAATIDRQVERVVEEERRADDIDTARSSDEGTVRELLRSATGLDVLHVVQGGRDTPHYYLQLRDQAAPVLVGTSLLDQAPVARALIDQIGHTGVADLPRKGWPAVRAALVRLVRRDDDTERERRGETLGWVLAEVEAAERGGRLERSYDVVKARTTFVERGHVYVNAARIHQRARHAGRASISLGEVVARLRELGFGRGPNAQGSIVEPGPAGEPAAATRYWRAAWPIEPPPTTGQNRIDLDRSPPP